jgi:N-acetylglucosamine kinase-like BadF-type ATPase
MADYYFGIDAGNSKTHAMIADASGHVLSLVQLGNGNWEGIGLERAREVYHAALDRALLEASLTRSQISAAAYGLAGYDFPSDDARLRPIIMSLGLPGRFFLENDTLIALRAGTTRPYGVVCIAGAGSTKAGRAPDGSVFRTWGLGEHMGDGGGGGWLCQRALGAVAQAAKGISPPTLLTEKLLAHYNVAEVTSLIELVERKHGQRIDYAHLVFEAAQDNDPVAVQLLLDAGHELARGCNAVIRSLNLTGESFELVLAGGVFRNENSLLRQTLTADVQAFAPGADVIRLSVPPVAGAVLLAMDEHGCSPDPTVRTRLAEGVRAKLTATL